MDAQTYKKYLEQQESFDEYATQYKTLTNIIHQYNFNYELIAVYNRDENDMSRSFRVKTGTSTIFPSDINNLIDIFKPYNYSLSHIGYRGSIVLFFVDKTKIKATKHDIQ